jgi:hypothetical protein
MDSSNTEELSASIWMSVNISQTTRSHIPELLLTCRVASCSTDMQSGVLFYGHAEWRLVLQTCRVASCSADMQSGVLFCGHAEWRLVLRTCRVASCSLDKQSSITFPGHEKWLHVLWTCKLASCSVCINSDPHRNRT